MLPEAVFLHLNLGKFLFIIRVCIVKALVDFSAFNSGIEILVKTAVGKGRINKSGQREADNAVNYQKYEERNLHRYKECKNKRNKNGANQNQRGNGQPCNNDDNGIADQLHKLHVIGNHHREDDFIDHPPYKQQQKQFRRMRNFHRQKTGYSNEKYFLKLISIYKKKDKQKYLDLLNKYFIEHQNIETYRQIKNNYSKDEWSKKIIFYLEKVKNSRVYIDICIEEEYYDELLKYLEDEWIEMLNKYLEILVKHRPKETLQLYKNKILTEIDRASCRKHYQKVLSYFENLLKIPKGKNGLKEIINYVRESYKNKKALQEEIDFFEETYM